MEVRFFRNGAGEKGLSGLFSALLVSVAATSVPTATPPEIFLRGEPTQLQRLANVLVNGLLDLLQLLLGIQKTPRHGIAQKHFAIPLERGNLGLREFHTLHLLVVEMFSRLADACVLASSLVVDEELLDAQAGALEPGLGQDGTAEILEFVLDGCGQAIHWGDWVSGWLFLGYRGGRSDHRRSPRAIAGHHAADFGVSPIG